MGLLLKLSQPPAPMYNPQADQSFNQTQPQVGVTNWSLQYLDHPNPPTPAAPAWTPAYNASDFAPDRAVVQPTGPITPIHAGTPAFQPNKPGSTVQMNPGGPAPTAAHQSLLSKLRGLL